MPQDILITPYKDSTSSGAKIEFTGLNSGASTITMRVLPDSTLSYEGTAGQLFSISNGLSSGTIFSVNDISGVPSIDVVASGLVRLAPFNGEVQTNKLYVQANPQSGTQTVQEWRNLSGTAMASVNTSGFFNGYLSSGMAINNVIANPTATSGLYYLDFTPTLSGNAGTFTSSGLVYNPGPIRLGIGTSQPTSRLHFVQTSGTVNAYEANFSTSYALFSGGLNSGSTNYAYSFNSTPYRASSRTTDYAMRIGLTCDTSIPSGPDTTNERGGLYLTVDSNNNGSNAVGYGLKLVMNYPGATAYGVYSAFNGIPDSTSYAGYFSNPGAPNAYGIYAECSNTGGLRNSTAGQFRIPANVTLNAYGLLVNTASITVGGVFYGAYIDASGVTTANSGKIAVYATDGTTTATICNSSGSAALFTGGNVGIRTSTPSGTLHVETGSATRIGAIVRGFTSQSANLQEWQNSAGTVVAAVDANGRFLAQASGAFGGFTFVNDGGADTGMYSSGDGSLYFNTNNSRILTLGTHPTITGNSLTVSTAGISSADSFRVIKGATTNFISDWLGNAGVNTANPSGRLHVEIGSTTRIGIIARAASAQTANLIELQDSAGNYVGAMNAGGSLSFTDNSPSISGTISNLVTSGSFFVRLNCTWSGSALTGVAPITGGSHINGRLMRLYNAGTQPMKLTNMATSTATNRFQCYNSGDLWMSPNDYYECIYDVYGFNGSNSSGAWRVNA